MKPSHVSAAINACVAIHRPLFLWGAPGVGKSDIVRTAAHAMRGRGGILFLDEMNSAPPQTQAALYQLVLDRKVGDYILPDGWHIVAAGNRTNDRGVVHRMPDPLVDRMFHVTYETDLEDWCRWAYNPASQTQAHPDNLIDFRAALRDAVDIMGLPGMRQDPAHGPVTFYAKPAGLPREAIGEPAARVLEPIAPEVVAFIRFREKLLHNHDTGRECVAFSTPRGWADVSLLMGLQLPAVIESELIRGRVGDGAASEFIAYLKLYRAMVTPDEVLAAPLKVKVPDNVGVLYALAEALARRADAENFARVLQFARRMPQEYAQCLVSSAVRLTPDLTGTRDYIQWAAEGR
jgi:hypothetical protein